MKEFEDLILNNDHKRIVNMSDQEAIDILRTLLKNGQLIIGRGNGKTRETLRMIRAISKGIESLEERSEEHADTRSYDFVRCIHSRNGRSTSTGNLAANFGVRYLFDRFKPKSKSVSKVETKKTDSKKYKGGD